MKIKIITALTLVISLWGAREAQAGIYSSGTSYAIADSPSLGTSSAITITDPGLVSFISSVTFSIVGGWAGDYSVALQYTDGTITRSSILFNALQGGLASNNGFDNVVLTTATGSAISGAGSTTASTAISGTYSGVDYSAFNGVSAAGSWILYVTDNQSGDHGTLTGWSLDVTPVPEPVNVALGIFAGIMGLVILARSQPVKRLLAKKQKS
jgi:hypothetical protein